MDEQQPLPSHATEHRILRRTEVEQITGFKRSQLYHLIKIGKFPRQIRLGVRAVGWDSDEIALWVNERRQDRI